MIEAGNIRNLVYSGVFWNTVARFAQQVLQFAISVVLARLLVPEDFGHIGMILVFIGLAGLFTDVGFSTALVQRQRISEEAVNSVFWLSLTLGFALSALIYLAAPWIAAFYNVSTLEPLIRVMAFGFLISSLANVPVALLQKRMQFKALAKMTVTAQLLSGALAVILAMLGCGVWSLAMQFLLSRAATSGMAWWLSGWRPRGQLSLKALRDLWGFTIHFTGFNLVNYWARNLDNMLVGKFMGSMALGNYSRAYGLMLLPITHVIGLISNVMFPALSGIQRDQERVKRIYLRAMAVIALISFPVMTGLMVTADPFVLTFFGPKWTGVAPLLQILALVGAMQALTNPVGWIYLSQGRTDWMFRFGLVSSSVVILAILIGIMLGTVEAVAACYAIANVVLFYPTVLIPGKLIRMAPREVVRTVSGPLAASVAMGALVVLSKSSLPASWASWLQLAVLASLGAGCYGAWVIGFRLEAWNEVVSFGKEIRLKTSSAMANVGALPL